MKLFLFIFQFIAPTIVICIPKTQNKTSLIGKSKRTITAIQNPGDGNPVGIVYHIENAHNPSSYQQQYNPQNEPNHLNNFYTNSNKFFTQSSAPIKTVFETGSKINPSVKNVFEDTPKVAAQHVLYEYEQTPTNAVSNVHVKQLFQPVNEFNEDGKSSHSQKIPTTPEQNHYITSAETAVNPVQHSALVNHAQNYAYVNHPLYHVQPTHVQHQQYIPNKYLYVNGKIVYQPGQQPNPGHVVPRTSFQNYQTYPQNNPNYQVANQNHNTPYHHNKQHQNLPLIKPVNRAPLQKLIPPPMNFLRFQPPPRSQMQQITQPVSTPQGSAEVEEHSQEDEENDKEQLRDEEEELEGNDEEGGEKANLEDDEEEAEEGEVKVYRPEKLHNLFGKYHFDDEDDDKEERQSYRHHEDSDDEEAEEDDRDSNRGSSKYVTSKTRKPRKKSPKNSGKYDKKDNYSYSEGYSTSSKYESPGKSKKGKNKPKHHYKKVKYSTNSNSKPKYEVIEGKQSEHIPITHKHKFVKEKFYLTRSFNDGFDRSNSN